MENHVLLSEQKRHEPSSNSEHQQGSLNPFQHILRDRNEIYSLSNPRIRRNTVVVRESGFGRGCIRSRSGIQNHVCPPMITSGPEAI